MTLALPLKFNCIQILPAMRPSNKTTLIAIMTFNEIENLPRLVSRLRERWPETDILVVDDGSPDGTGKWCDEQARTDPHFFVEHRDPPRGLGGATLHAIRWAIRRNYDFILTMDADLSHDPTAIPQMQARMDQDRKGRLGVVIGSRYVDGGRIEGWPWRRRVTSRMVNRFARVALGLPTRDNTSAFRLYRVAALRRIDLDSVRSGSYVFLEEVLWRLATARFQLAEVPIRFTDREQGKSKAGPVVIVKSAVDLMRLGWSHLLAQR